MNKKLLISGAILGLLSVVLGAFAAHSLEDLVEAKAIKSFETGVRYQMYHALFLLFVGGATFISKKAKTLIFYMVIIGLIFFSGSIYVLATNDLSTFNFKQIAMITPIGGLLLIIAWLLLCVNIVKSKFE